MVAKNVTTITKCNRRNCGKRGFARSYGEIEIGTEREGSSVDRGQWSKRLSEEKETMGMSNAELVKKIEAMEAENVALKQAVAKSNGFSFKAKEAKYKDAPKGAMVMAMKVGDSREWRHTPALWATFIPEIVAHAEEMLKACTEQLDR